MYTIYHWGRPRPPTLSASTLYISECLNKMLYGNLSFCSKYLHKTYSFELDIFTLILYNEEE